MKNKLSFLLFACLVVLSCSKEDDETETEPTKTDLIAQQAWKFESAGIDLDKNGTIDNNLPASLLPPCLTDNTATFTKDGNGTTDEGASKCQPTDPQTSSFTWSFASNETVINIKGNAIAGISGGQFRIVELTETRFSLAKDTSVQGLPVALIANLKH